MTAPQVTDEMTAAAVTAYFAGQASNATSASMRAALEAALKVSQPAPTRTPKEIARNIVNQLGDLWEVPVPLRQASNDRADDFVWRLIARVIPDDEEFCPKCFAGMDAANHNECIDVRQVAGFEFTDAAIEAAAKAIFSVAPRYSAKDRRGWDEVEPREREFFRDQARSALEAARTHCTPADDPQPTSGVFTSGTYVCSTCQETEGRHDSAKHEAARLVRKAAAMATPAAAVCNCRLGSIGRGDQHHANCDVNLPASLRSGSTGLPAPEDQPLPLAEQRGGTPLPLDREDKSALKVDADREWAAASRHCNDGAVHAVHEYVHTDGYTYRCLAALAATLDREAAVRELTKVLIKQHADEWYDVPGLASDLADAILALVPQPAEPECDCYPGGFSPDSYEGVQEHCKVHGRQPGSVANREALAEALTTGCDDDCERNGEDPCPRCRQAGRDRADALLSSGVIRDEARNHIKYCEPRAAAIRAGEQDG